MTDQTINTNVGNVTAGVWLVQWTGTSSGGWNSQVSSGPAVSSTVNCQISTIEAFRSGSNFSYSWYLRFEICPTASGPFSAAITMSTGGWSTDNLTYSISGMAYGCVATIEYNDIVHGVIHTDSYDTGSPTGVAEFTIIDAVPVRSGYAFLGWGLTESSDPSSLYHAGDTIHIAAGPPQTVYAVWRRFTAVNVQLGNWDWVYVNNVGQWFSSGVQLQIPEGDYISVEWYERQVDPVEPTEGVQACMTLSDELYVEKGWHVMVAEGSQMTVYPAVSKELYDSSSYWKDFSTFETITSILVQGGHTATVQFGTSLNWTSPSITDSKSGAYISVDYPVVDRTKMTIHGIATGWCELIFHYVDANTGIRYRSILNVGVRFSYLIATSHNRGGTVDETTTVGEGHNATVRYSADQGFEIYKVLVDGVENPSAATMNAFTISDVRSDHSLQVLFVETVIVGPLRVNEPYIDENLGHTSAGLQLNFSGSPPPGMTMYAKTIAGVPYIAISGTPTAAGHYTVLVSDTASIPSYWRVAITVGNAATYRITLSREVFGDVDGQAFVHINDASLSGITPPKRTGYQPKGYYTGETMLYKIADPDGTLYPSISVGLEQWTDAQGHWKRASDTTFYTMWQVATYTIQFNACGGSVSPTEKTVTYGQTYGSLPVPVRPGFSFAGWWTSSTGGTRITASTTVGEDANGQTLYAQWTDPVKASGTWSIQGPTSTDRISELHAAVDRDGEVWYQNPSASLTDAEVFSGDDDILIAEIVDADSSVHYTGIKVTGISLGTVDLTIRFLDSEGVLWYDTLPTAVGVVVNLDANGGALPLVHAMITDAYGRLRAPIPTPTYTGRVFNGWWTEASGGDQVSESTVFEAETTVYAHWIVGYSLRFDANGGTDAPPNQTSDDTSSTHTFAIPSDVPTREGYLFLKWNTNAGGTGTSYSAGSSITLSASSPSITLYAIWTADFSTFTIHYVATGASNIPSDQTSTVPQSRLETTVSSTVPTLSGKVFWGWSRINGAVFPDNLPGSTIFLDPGTTNLYAVWEPDTPPLGGRVDNVRIYLNPLCDRGAEYIDVSNRLVRRSRIHEVENYGMVATFTIVNDLTTSLTNILAGSFSRWRDPATGESVGWSGGHHGGIATGMFVQIRDTSASGYCWGTFMITSLEASEDLINVTCGDYIQVLRSTGADYFRNHYDIAGLRYVREFADRGTSNDIVIDRPVGVTLVGGNAGDVKYMAPQTGTYHSSKVALSTSSSVTSICTLTDSPSNIRTIGRVGVEYIKVTLHSNQDSLGPNTVNYTISLYAMTSSANNDAFIQSWEVQTTSMSDTEFTLDLTTPYDLSAFVALKIVIEGAYDTSSTFVGTYRSTEGSDWTTSIHGSTYDNYALYCTIGWLVYQNASGTNTVDDNNNPVFSITSISTVSTIDGSLITPGLARAWITYQDASTSLNLSLVASSILQAAGGYLICAYTDRIVNMFRCGGDFFHSYLLTLADMVNSNGDQMAFCAAPDTWSVVNMGVRPVAEDDPLAVLKFAQVTGQSGIVMMSFNPRLSKNHRPAIAVAKGTRNDGIPIIVTVKDPSISIGSSVTVLGSSESSELDAASAAYSQIMTNRSTSWEGEAVISGISAEWMLRSGNRIGGIPIRIYDSRYGMNAYKARVRECTVDYQDLKTTLVLNNYSEIYSNAVVDTTKMSYQAGNLAALSTTAELYTRQYLFIDTSYVLSPDETLGYQLQIYFNEQLAESVEADVIRYPELGIATLVGFFPAGNVYSDDQYPIDLIGIQKSGSSAVSLRTVPEHHRPDKHLTQYLILNVQCRLP